MKLHSPVYRVTTKDVRNAWLEIVHMEGEIMECTHDMGWAWLARRAGLSEIARMLPKHECRELTEDEQELVNELLKED